jgi:hypothetical protein
VLRCFVARSVTLVALGIAALLALVGACVAEVIDLRRSPRPIRGSNATSTRWAIPVARVLVAVGVAVAATAIGVVAGIGGAFVCAFAVSLGLATATDRIRPAIAQVRATAPIPPTQRVPVEGTPGRRHGGSSAVVPDLDRMPWQHVAPNLPDSDASSPQVIDLSDELPGYGADLELEQDDGRPATGRAR